MKKSERIDGGGIQPRVGTKMKKKIKSMLTEEDISNYVDRIKLYKMSPEESQKVVKTALKFRRHNQK